MGSTSSKFRRYLQRGDEFAAMQIYQNSPDLRKTLNPNLSYGDSHHHHTALHYAAKHGMKHLLRTFLYDLSGNPNKRNAFKENVLHCVCKPCPNGTGFGSQDRRAACVQLLILWKGVALPLGGYERTDLEAQDASGNTALHWAALSGLKRCVELLVSHGAPLFVENNEKLTPCDLAMKASHHEIAEFLESRMVFTDNVDLVNESDFLDSELTECSDEIYSGLRNQDLQEAKDQLLVDTSDMLKVPLFTAEALLRNNEWSKQHLLEKWMNDPIECCRVAGVPAPSSVLQKGGSLNSSMSSEVTEELFNIICDICMSPITESQRPIKMSCKHIFCKFCWSSYLTTKIQDGEAHHILCPAFQCPILVPVETIEKLVSPEVAKRYLQFDIKAFVESNKSIKWCPVAGCGRAVRLPDNEHNPSNNSSNKTPYSSHAVDCGNSHYFCWECLGPAHSPCDCKQWQDWHIKIGDIKPEELRNANNGTEDAASCLWLVTNSKPCPNCKSPIQKNEGCNHIKCSKCKFDFCWVCQEAWKKHSSATGGYFRCNRFEATSKADEKQDVLISEALNKNNQMQELSKFLHYYTRFRNHENSAKLEEPLLINVQRKMQVLASTLGMKNQEEALKRNSNFIEDGINELLKSRRALCGSYVYGYYLQDDGHNKVIFEFMQNELETITEKLSEMVARPYLRTPKAIIIQTSILVRRKRHEFIRAVTQGLIPPDTLKKKKRKHFDKELLATSSWLDRCNGANEEVDPVASKMGKLDRDYNMELIIALEMSRLQIIEDCMKHTKKSSTAIQNSSFSKNRISKTNDEQLNLAIQLSLQEAKVNRSENFENNVAERTVNYFLKSLANGSINLDAVSSKQFSEACTNTNPDPHCTNQAQQEGTFHISDIHENGFNIDQDYSRSSCSSLLRKAHSTSDLYVTKRLNHTRLRSDKDEPRYHLDSDHSMQHDDTPEDISAAKMGLINTLNRRKKLLLLHEANRISSNTENTSVEETITSDIEPCGMPSSVEDDSFGNYSLDSESNVYKTEEALPTSTNDGKMIVSNLPPFPHMKRVSVFFPTGITNGLEANEKIGLECKSVEHSPKMLKPRTVSFSKSTESLAEHKTVASVSIKIDEWKKQYKASNLETDSSNEYESETGIPKSPTLFISGVSISRSPEPSPPSSIAVPLANGRQFRSSSLSVPEPDGPKLLHEVVSRKSNSNGYFSNNPIHTITATSSSPKSKCTTSTALNGKDTKSGDFNPATYSGGKEGELETEIFKFPKSSTDGALSSVLHIRESNLSSDDFHEALFLLEARSPKDSKRRKRSKKKDCKDEQCDK